MPPFPIRQAAYLQYVKKILTACAAVLLMSVGSFAQNAVTALSTTVFAKKIKETPRAVVVDVRTPEEFAKGHLANAVNINWNGPDFTTLISKLNKTALVLVYCHSGRRSADAAASMRTLGFAEVLELEGGILKWREMRLPEETPVPATNMTPQQFASLLNTDKTVLVDVYADWCRPCKLIEPFVLQIEEEKAATIKVVRINTDHHPELANALQVSSIPTLMVFKNGKLKEVSIGLVSKAKILKMLK
ncbi:MAG: trxA [Flaviaesturariibacter sp.]|nr:trxA [Flaviaesturariibacter sp.]